MAPNTRRALHYVYKIGDRTATAAFYKDILGMTILRHEEFEAGCEATCNGPYSGKWSKTMVGCGAEDSHFVCELTYNYGISTYKQGNSFQGLYLHGPEVLSRAAAAGVPMEDEGDSKVLYAPGGYKFVVSPQPAPSNRDLVYKVALSSSHLAATVAYWCGVLGLRSADGCPDGVARLSYADDQATLEFRQIDCPVDHAKAGGRVAFSCPSSELQPLEERVRAAGHTVLTPYIALDTPGKATVKVVILADPDGHEICFVGDEGFRELSAVDPVAGDLLAAAIAKDGSNEWFSKRGGKQEEA